MEAFYEQLAVIVDASEEGCLSLYATKFVVSVAGCFRCLTGGEAEAGAGLEQGAVAGGGRAGGQAGQRQGARVAATEAACRRTGAGQTGLRVGPAQLVSRRRHRQVERLQHKHLQQATQQAAGGRCTDFYILLFTQVFFIKNCVSFLLE